MKNINYIVVYYIGPNRTYESYQRIFKQNPLFFAYKQIEFLSTCNNDIKTATFVFNDDISDELKTKILDELKLSNMNLEIIFRPNNGFSYGAWRDVISKNLNDYDYFVMIEDDSIPTIPMFYEPFIERMSSEIPYVCCYMEYHNGIQFPSSSNGIIKAEQCKVVLEKCGEMFFVNSTTDYHSAWDTQMRFYTYFSNCGYKMTDILDSYSTHHMLNCHFNDLRIFGNPENPPLIVPIVVEL